MQQRKEVAADRLKVEPDDLEASDGVLQSKSDSEKQIDYALVASTAIAAGGPLVATGSKPGLPTAPGYVVAFAEVLVDPETGQVDLVKLLEAQDVGFAINPKSVEGQIQGGAVQGFGYAVTEELLFDDEGRAINTAFLDYRLPTSYDTPDVDAVIVEVPNPHGPYGARIVGEPPIIPPGAAITNAIAAAIGKSVYYQPMTPERILQALGKPVGDAS
jgi:CO/xanthine dehydrogenase Mo-binding subunit